MQLAVAEQLYLYTYGRNNQNLGKTSNFQTFVKLSFKLKKKKTKKQKQKNKKKNFSI